MENSKLDLVVFGWALSGAIVVLFALCEVAVVILPGRQLAHNWLALFLTADVGTIRNLFDGAVFSAIFGWIMATVLVSIYNRLVRS